MTESGTDVLLSVFKVKCKPCGSEEVTVFTDIFHRPEFGVQGVVKIKCKLCDATAEIWKSTVNS